MARRISSDLLVMLIAAVGFTVFGAVTGGTFLVILCGSCLGLILIEVVGTLRHRTAQ